MICFSDESVCLNCKDDYLMALKSGIKYRGWVNSSRFRVDDLIKIRVEVIHKSTELLNFSIDKFDSIRSSGTNHKMGVRHCTITGLFSDLKNLLTDEMIGQKVDYRESDQGLIQYRFLFFKYERNPQVIEFFLSQRSSKPEIFLGFEKLLKKIQKHCQ